jgi:hypothetical protein
MKLSFLYIYLAFRSLASMVRDGSDPFFPLLPLLPLPPPM